MCEGVGDKEIEVKKRGNKREDGRKRNQNRWDGAGHFNRQEEEKSAEKVVKDRAGQEIWEKTAGDRKSNPAAQTVAD